MIDLDSRNGTRVNRERVTQVGLKTGDLILGGKTLIRVAIEGGDLPQTKKSPAVVQTPAGLPKATPAGEETLVPRGAIHRGKMAAVDADKASSVVRPIVRETMQFPAQPFPKDVGKVASPPPHSGPATPEPSTPHLPGYRILRKIGQGGMGVVFEVISTDDGRRYAVKVIRPDIAASEEDVSRFLREADILKSLCHRSIVRFHELRQAGGHLCIVMDFVDGPTLADFIVQQQVPLSPSAAVELILPLLDALGFAHSEGFVHRDVKPSNVLVAGGTSSQRQVLLADFGLARVYQASKLSGLTITAEIGGSAHFMPPEQITMFRQVSPLADQYSAAATLYFALTRKTVHDFPAEVSQQLLKILQNNAVSLGVRRPHLPVSSSSAWIAPCSASRKNGTGMSTPFGKSYFRRLLSRDPKVVIRLASTENRSAVALLLRRGLLHSLGHPTDRSRRTLSSAKACVSVA